jgi:hypothetical protein
MVASVLQVAVERHPRLDPLEVRGDVTVARGVRLVDVPAQHAVVAAAFLKKNGLGESEPGTCAGLLRC